MRVAKAVAVLGVLVMAAILIYGFTAGDFGREGQVLLSMPWGIVALVDVYLGFILFAGWIVYRERSVFQTIVWVALLLILGNLVAYLYVLIALLSSGASWRRFWMGHRASDGS